MQLQSKATALAVLLACAARVTIAATAHVLTLSPQADTITQPATGLSPSTARLVLAQRAGVEDYHTADGLNDDAIESINAFGSRTSLFENKSERAPAFFLLEIESDDEVPKSLRPFTSFFIEDAPSFASSRDLFLDLFRQARPSTSVSDNDLHDAWSLKHESEPTFHVVSRISSLTTLFTQLADQHVPVTVLLVPAGTRSSEWGTYSMPNAQSSLRKRQSSHRVEVEEPLSASFAAPAAASSPITRPGGSNSSSPSPLPGILPACYSSQRLCESTTRRCTGHGSCKLKYTNHDDKKGTECWSCSCVSTKNDGKTTQWGGPACQKKDISVEFWLIALFSIGMVALVGFAVGSVWSMGDEELPSVIGAGVSGPPRK